MISVRKNKSGSDNEFISELYRLYSAIVKKAVAARLYSTSIQDIEDCVREVFVEALSKCGELRKRPNPIGWFTVTSKNVTMKHNVKSMKESCGDRNVIENFPDTFCLDEQVAENIIFTELEKENAADKIADSLAAGEKKLYKLRWIRRLSYAEIGKELKISSSAVKSRISRLRCKIQDKVKAYIG